MLNIMSQENNLKLKAAISHFNSKRDTAMAELDNYLNSAVGVGEHPHVVEEVIKLFEVIDSASSVIETIENIIGTTNDETMEETEKIRNK